MSLFLTLEATLPLFFFFLFHFPEGTNYHYHGFYQFGVQCSQILSVSIPQITFLALPPKKQSLGLHTDQHDETLLSAEASCCHINGPPQ